MLRRHCARNDFAKSPQLLIRVKRLYRDKNVESRRARSLQETHNPQLFKFFLQRPSNGHHHRKLRSVRGVQIKKKVVWMIEIVEAARPRIVVNAAQSR